jgi:TetR/AcrR family transcriptional regulator, transcriptional repressor for nem operon
MSDTREIILKTSLKLFLQKSFKEVTMQEILKGTGLSKGTFYYYFSSKEKVFEEVITSFQKKYMNQDYGKFPQDSLKGFYSAYLKDIQSKNSSSREMIQDASEAFNFNHYYLVFDALKMLPGFKKGMLEQSKYELNCWKKLVATARGKNEIISAMSDEQIAQIFIYMGDGLGMQLIMQGEISKIGKLKSLYDGFYNSLKK